jgi:hypothetical protein
MRHGFVSARYAAFPGTYMPNDLFPLDSAVLRKKKISPFSFYVPQNKKG